MISCIKIIIGCIFRGARNPHGHGERTTHNTKNRESKLEEKSDPQGVPRVEPFSLIEKIASIIPKSPPKIDFVTDAFINSPTFESPRNQDNPIEEPHHSITS
jgi:hypothetical protein